MQMSEVPDWCIPGMIQQFNWTNVVQTSIDAENRVYAHRDCCIEKTFRYPFAQSMVETLGPEYYRDNYRYESNFDIYNYTRANTSECPVFFVASRRRSVREQISRRVAVIRWTLADFVRIRIGKKQLPCESDECRYVVSIYVDVDVQQGYIEQYWFRSTTSFEQVSPPGPNPPDQVFEEGNPTTWSAFVPTGLLRRETFVFVKTFATLPTTFTFNSSDDWECVQSACNSDAPRNVCRQLSDERTVNQNPTNVQIVPWVNPVKIIIGVGEYNPTWTNPNTGEVCFGPAVNDISVSNNVRPFDRRLEVFNNVFAFHSATAVSVESDFFSNTVDVCAPTPTIDVDSCSPVSPDEPPPI